MIFFREELKKSVLLDFEELFVTKVQRELLITRFYIENTPGHYNQGHHIIDEPGHVVSKWGCH